MSSMLRRACVISVVAVAVVACRQVPRGDNILHAAEATMRRGALHTVLPTYPASSARAGHSGVVVVDLMVGETGAVSRVAVLQAPDADIGDAVSDALRQWRFRPPSVVDSTKKYRMESKLTFYFRLTPRPRVLDPDEAAPMNASLAEPLNAPRQQQSEGWALSQSDVDRFLKRGTAVMVVVDEPGHSLGLSKDGHLYAESRSLKEDIAKRPESVEIMILDCSKLSSKSCDDDASALKHATPSQIYVYRAGVAREFHERSR